VAWTLLSFTTPELPWHQYLLLYVCYASAFIVLARVIALARRDVRHELTTLEAAADLDGLLDARKKRAHSLFRLSSAEVQQYYDQALRQRKYVFNLGVICLFIGFVSVAASLWIIYSQPETQLSDKIVVASLGAVSGILANFVAVIFLRMFSETVKSMVDFHQRLVTTHHTYLANLMASGITNEALRNSTLADLAHSIPSKFAPNQNSNS
jgi:hypothetical protein